MGKGALRAADTEAGGRTGATPPRVQPPWTRVSPLPAANRSEQRATGGGG